jgi:hypothetical protein
LTPVDPNENFSRYLFSRNNYSPTKQIVHYTAFIPPPDKRLSVFCVSGLSENAIWEIGENVGNQSDRKLSGRADIAALPVYEAGLSIDRNDIPFRHANIIGWPDEDSAIKLAAIELAQKAELSLK